MYTHDIYRYMRVIYYIHTHDIYRYDGLRAARIPPADPSVLDIHSTFSLEQHHHFVTSSS
jgi:hypothetical protein